MKRIAKKVMREPSQAIMLCREDSFLEELDDLNVEVEYRTALQNSVAYMLLSRCDIDPAEYLETEDFRHIFDFNTRQTVNALGLATSDISEMCLREISVTVLNLQRQEQNQNRTFAREPQQRDNIIVSNTERSFENGNLDIPHGGRLSPAQPDSPGGATHNALAGLPTRLQACEEQLDTAKAQLETAKTEVQKPFPQEEELKQKTVRLSELNSLLNMDEKGGEILDDGEQPEEEPKQRTEKERYDNKVSRRQQTTHIFLDKCYHI